MEGNAQYIASLLLKAKESLTESERTMLEDWRNNSSGSEEMFKNLMDSSFVLKQLDEYDKIEIPAVDELLTNIEDKNSSSLYTIRILKQSIPYLAAGILLLIGFFTVSYFINIKIDAVNRISENSIEINPGKNKAQLFLSDGTVLDLEDSQEGLSISGDEISYLNGETLLDISKEIIAKIHVPRGGQYQIVLSDGTRVWLNAESELTYPVKFKGTQRRVSLVGEAYFAVKHNSELPFVVSFNSNEIEVLGTSFNVQAYSGASESRTTLAEGSIRIRNNSGNTVVMKPHEQAMIMNDQLTLKKVDIDPYVLWRDGIIVLDKQDIKSIIPQLERWYNVEFEMQNIPSYTATLSGEIPRNVPLNSVLQVLEEQLKLKFEINGRRIMIKS